MLKDITIGQYYPANSKIHKLDPRTKIIAAIIFMIALFVINQFWPYVIVFGIIAVGLTYLSGTGKGHNMNTIVLAGIMIGSLFSALVSFVKFVADSESQLPAITYWLMGSLASASYKTLLLGAPFIIVGIFVLYLLRWRLNILMLSEDEAKSSGTNIKLLRTITIIAATMVTGSCVSMCGQVGWVGLIIPHMCRMKFGNNHLSLVPASISIGAVFMVIVDTIARSLVATEIPISILTAIVGAPFFITLMRVEIGRASCRERV